MSSCWLQNYDRTYSVLERLTDRLTETGSLTREEVQRAFAGECTGSAQLCEALGLPAQHQAIVSWPDPDGSQLKLMTDAGIRISGRAGRARASFHLWNTEEDVVAIVRAVR